MSPKRSAYIVALCFSLAAGDKAVACTAAGACDDDDVTSLLAIQQRLTPRKAKAIVEEKIEQSGKATTPESRRAECKKVSKTKGLECCAAAKDCSPYSMQDATSPAMTFDWLSQGCKARNNDVCVLWKPCLGDGGSLRAGAESYLTSLRQGDKYTVKSHGTSAANEMLLQGQYCEKVHCDNDEFDLDKTTPAQSEAYCDKKYGDKWRNHLAGPFGMGFDDHPASGLWECAHQNFQCDWAYCKIGFCQQIQDKKDTVELMNDF